MFCKKASAILSIHERVKVLRLSLSIFTRDSLNDYTGRKRIRFVVVDIDRSKEYPLNFVCILPKQIKENDGRHTKFERRFGDESLELAKKLLKRSLKVENDWVIKEAIRERLKLLKQKPRGNTTKNCSYARSQKILANKKNKK
jgi:hypothetical protein